MVFYAKIKDLRPDNCVVRYRYFDFSNQTQYMAANYWAFTIVTTLGYGDILAGNPFEADSVYILDDCRGRFLFIHNRLPVLFSV